MKIAYGSDFHFEFRNDLEVAKIINNWIFDADTELIIIAGDLHVGAVKVIEILEFIHGIHNIPIIYVPGNHEYYGSSFKKENTLFHNLRFDLSDIYIFLEDHVTIDGITFCGCAGNIDGSYEDIHVYKHGALNDFYQISDFEDHKMYGKREHTFMYEIMAEIENRCVAITHTMPSPKCISDQYKGSHLNPCFANDWEWMIQIYKPEFWICGHTHDVVDVKIGETHVLANPAGYPHENKKWKWEYINV